MIAVWTVPRRGLVLALGVLAACSAPQQPSDWHQEAGYRWRELRVAGGKPGFARLSPRKTGIRFENTVSDSLLAGNRMLGQGAGVALGDVDGDGLVDIFLARTEGCSALYRNLGGLKFEDIANQAGVAACDRNSSAVTFADFDADGDLDLILLATRGPNAIFVNDGAGKFTERRDLGLESQGNGGTAITLADVSGSGRLDLFIANYKAYNIDDSLPPQQHTFNQLVRQTGPSSYEVVPRFQGEYKLVMRPDLGGLRVTQRGARNEFYVNEGGRFSRVPLTAGRFLEASSRPLSEEPESFSLGARFADLNGDGAPDLYVANDFEDTDQLWWNDGRGSFRLADWNAQRQLSNSTMSVAVGDVNADGLPDMFTTDMMANDSKRARTQIPTNTPFPKKPGEKAMQLQQQRNSLFINRGDGTFAEVADIAGVEASGWSWGSVLMDVDLDGWDDILVAAGHLWDVMDADVIERLQGRLTDISWRQLKWQYPTLSLENVAFRNRGDMTFEDVSAKWNFGNDKAISHALAAGDLDGDGDLDVVVNRLRSPALVLRNDASAPRVAVRLAGDAPNTRGVGAKVRLLGGAVPTQVREVQAGGLYMSHSDYETSFAMGTSASATLVVDWRDGRQTTIADVRPNRLYEISQSTAATPPRRDSAKRQSLFADVSSQLRGHQHTENPFDDWDRQYLLPTALSQLGPGIAWFDLDRDGNEDLVIGTGKGGTLGVFRNTSGTLSRIPSDGPVAAADYTAILGLPENGRVALIAGVSTWEFREPADPAKQPAAVAFAVNAGRPSVGPVSLISSHESVTGPLALVDYDEDGDLDLFVGAGAIPMRYPVSAGSGLFKNEGNGRFVLDYINAEALRDIGLVSSAVFADVNGDGHTDLLIARDWGSIALLLNDGHARFSAAPESWGLSKLTSRWNGIATGDLDGDGRLDLVATSWGRNTEMKADSANPLILAHGPFGAKREEEMILARYDARLKALAPLTSYTRLRTSMPDIITRLRTYAEFADASLEKVLGPAAGPSQQLRAVTMDHTVFFNRGDHFEAKPLPEEAQRAPAFSAGVADFNGDGFEDVFLAQNFSPTMVGMQRYDAGRGLLLAGDGSGNLSPLAGDVSGIRVYGDQRGAAYSDYDGDGRLDLALSQNGDSTRLFHNVGAKPGLRVRVQGPPNNPDGVGVQVRVVYGEKLGPVREIESGSGYWSQNGAVQVMGLSGTPTAVWARWPGGEVTQTPVPAGTKEVLLRSRRVVAAGRAY